MKYQKLGTCLAIVFLLFFQFARADWEHGVQHAIDALLRLLFFGSLAIAELVVFILFLRRKQSWMRWAVQVSSGILLTILVVLCFHPVKKTDTVWMVAGLIYSGTQFLLSFAINAKDTDAKTEKVISLASVPLWLLVGFLVFRSITAGDLPSKQQLAMREG